MKSASLGTSTEPVKGTAVLTQPGLLLRIEGAVLLIGTMRAYGTQGGNWWLFAVLLLVPDLAMLGYFVGPRIGATSYNLAHNYVPPALGVAYAVWAGQPLALQLAFIWLAHIGMDRMLGYGLKYPTVFQDTHLQRV